MNKSELIEALAQRTGQTKVASGELVDVVLDLLGQTLAEGESVQLAGFGSFQVSTRAARTGRNPATGEPIKIAASKGVKFTAGKPLKERVNPVTSKGKKRK
ncbi:MULTISPECIES: HU family DNA-binding protein [Burkholderia]|uniref:HU family DNA-binding protein n=1 Tax=Burkholderia TaxID=32008 RepID=UPI001588865B|nr:HU family DNA-binding protein [Burkholderia seminalis]